MAGLVGHPVAHSLSPILFEAAWGPGGGSYALVDTSPDNLAATVARIREQRWDGFNVTLPHKSDVTSHLDGLDSSARGPGACNCVVRTSEGRLVGYNTDAEALLSSLSEEGGLEPRGLTVLLLGAGGVARAAAYALAGRGARVEALARRPEKAASLPGVSATYAWPETGVLELPAADILIQCTPVGMEGGPPSDPWDRLVWDAVPPDALIVDLVYRPEDTALLGEARRTGRRTLGGRGMLVRQAEASFALWTGQPPPAGAMDRAAQAFLAR